MNVEDTISSDYDLSILQLSSAGISQETAEDNFTIYPNPAKDMAVISTTMYSFNDTKVIVRDMMGKIVNEMSFNNNKIYFNTATYENGIYFVSHSEKGKTTTKKLIINN
jgi:hypothetical protein